jgi:hypothetical protein
MNSNVLIGITVIFVLLVAGCGLWMNAASNEVDKTIDHAVELLCYDSGYSDGASGTNKPPPFSDDRCVEVYSGAYSDGLGQDYRPPSAE